MLCVAVAQPVVPVHAGQTMPMWQLASGFGMLLSIPIHPFTKPMPPFEFHHGRLCRGGEGQGQVTFRENSNLRIPPILSYWVTVALLLCHPLCRAVSTL